MKNRKITQDIVEKPELMSEGFYSEGIGHSPEEYDSRHIHRYHKTIELLGLDKVENSRFCDMGCGPGYILNRMNKNNQLFGFDSFKFEHDYIKYYQVDFDYERFSRTIKEEKFDYIMTLETFEHLTNPYNFIFEAKAMLKENANLYLSIPNADIEHNTFYPALIYPKQNFIEFMQQMAFELKRGWSFPTRFGSVTLYDFVNKPWSENKMKFIKKEPLRSCPPHIQVNI